MPNVKTIIPAGTTVRYITIGSNTMALMPLGSTAYTPPTSPSSSGSYVTIYSQEWEIETDPNAQQATDASNPPKNFHKYIGGRPTGR